MDTENEDDFVPEEIHIERSRLITVSDAIEETGFGWAQLRFTFLGPFGIFCCDGAELVLGNVTAMSISNEMGLGRNERASLASFTLLGLMLGNLTAGYYGDRLGRRVPILWCYGLTSSLGFVSAHMPDFFSLIVCRTLLGWCMGIGMPASSAMVSECTPEVWRMFLRVLVVSAFSVGCLYIGLISALGDPSLSHLHWRFLMMAAAIPPAVWWVLAWLFLPESPVFLASVGENEAAVEGIKSMRRLNGIERGEKFRLPQTNLHMNVLKQMQTDNTVMCIDFRGQLETIFSKKLWYVTVTAMFTAFSVNLVSYGDIYASPQVLGKTSVLPAAWELVIKAIVSALWAFVAGAIAQIASREQVLLLTVAVASTVCFAFAIGGSFPQPRPWPLMLLFQYGVNGSSVVGSLGYTVIYQFAAEIYPTTAASTGSGLIMGTGRLAAIAAPLLFENIVWLTGQWTVFYYFMGAVASIAVVFVAIMPATPAYRSGYDDVIESSTLSDTTKSKYGSCPDGSNA